MAAINIQLPKFEKNGDWQLYSEQLENYFVINEYDDDKKVSILLTLLSQTVYKVLRESCDPVLPKDKTYDQLNSLLKIHFSSKVKKVTVNVFEERRKFFRAFQWDKETIQQWYDRVREMSTTCSFNQGLEDILRDKFICGLRNERIFKKLSQEKGTIELREALEIAIKSDNWEGAQNTQKNVNLIKNDNAKYQKSTAICKHCGGTKHDFKVCRDKGYCCDKCGENGHLEKACYLYPNKKTNSQPVNDLTKSCNKTHSNPENKATIIPQPSQDQRNVNINNNGEKTLYQKELTRDLNKYPHISQRDPLQQQEQLMKQQKQQMPQQNVQQQRVQQLQQQKQQLLQEVGQLQKQVQQKQVQQKQVQQKQVQQKLIQQRLEQQKYDLMNANKLSAQKNEPIKICIHCGGTNHKSETCYNTGHPYISYKRLSLAKPSYLYEPKVQTAHPVSFTGKANRQHTRKDKKDKDDCVLS